MRGAADHVDLAAHLLGDRGAPLARHRRERPPCVGRRIVLPRVVHRFPAVGARTAQRPHAAAEHINLSVVFGLRLVMHRDRNRLLLRPPIGGRIVFVDHGRRGPTVGAESADHVHLAARLGSVELLLRFRKRRSLRPAQRTLRLDERAHSAATRSECGHDDRRVHLSVAGMSTSSARGCARALIAPPAGARARRATRWPDPAHPTDRRPASCR